MADSPNSPIYETFTGTGSTDPRFVKSNSQKTLIIMVDGETVSINAEASYDLGQTWVLVKNWVADTVENFEWKGDAALIRFTVATFDTGNIIVSFK